MSHPNFEIERVKKISEPPSSSGGYQGDEKPDEPADGMSMQECDHKMLGDMPSGSGDAGGSGGNQEHDNEDQSSSEDSDNDDDDDDDDGGDDDPASEPEVELTHGCPNCAILQKEVNRLSLNVEALALVIANKWENNSLPEDRLELFQLQETLKKLQIQTKNELNYMQYVEGYAIYAKSLETNQTIKVTYNGSVETISSVKVLIMERLNLPKISVNQRKWMVVAGALSLKPDGTRITPLSLLDKSTNRCKCKTYLAHTSLIEFGVRGSGGVKNAYMKKPDAIAFLKKRVQTNVRKSDACFDREKLPEQVQSFADDIVKQVGEMKLYQSQGVAVVRAVLSKCPVDTLKEIETIADVKQGRNGNSEERVAKIIELLYPSLIVIEECKTSLDGLKEQVLEDLMALFVNEYHTYMDGKPARMDLATFGRDVGNVLKERNPHAQIALPNSPNCDLM
eukprot:Skav235429  [mRNA]  locus=scaffold473:162132:163484:+ [translate_table: standard]